MLIKNGEELLKEFSDTAYPFKVHKINERIYHVVGLGHSNATFIIGNTSIILVDTLDSDERSIRMLEEIRKISDKPVKTIIYTHGHPDHRGGSGTFKDSAKEIIKSAVRKPVLKHYDKIDDILMHRTIKQFGYKLNDEDVISQGIGIREGLCINDGNYDFLAPTTIFNDEEIERVIDGVNIKLVSAVGETDDQLFVWLEDDKVLCCGDTYYGCWPNLYAIRGSQYRDVAQWVDSLEQIMKYPMKALLPGHTNPILEDDKIQEVLSNFKGAIESILLQTLQCMNQGMSVSKTIEVVTLPKKYQDIPYLGEFYGTINWSVKSIYNGYLGWFDGNPTNLYKQSDVKYNTKLLELIGSDEKVMGEIKKSIAYQDYQMALELCDVLMISDTFIDGIKELKIEALMGISKMTISANARHYYIASAKELVLHNDY